MNPINLAAAAERLAGEGIAVFPCRADKRPATSHGKNDATSDPAAARRLFLRARDAVIIARTTGAAAGIVVVDVDPQGMECRSDAARRLSYLFPLSRQSTPVLGRKALVRRRYTWRGGLDHHSSFAWLSHRQ